MVPLQGFDLPSISSVITAIASIVAAVGVYWAFRQTRVAARGIKAQALMKLIDEWRSREVYESIAYVHKLRADWKKTDVPVDEWSGLAREWVRLHADKRPDSSDPNERELAKEWMQRRTASQFLSKMGLLLIKDYLDSDDLFEVVPEVGRLLVVLRPIEDEIKKFWQEQEKNPVADWDRPVGKWEFDDLRKKYLEWCEKHSSIFEQKRLSSLTD